MKSLYSFSVSIRLFKVKLPMLWIRTLLSKFHSLSMDAYAFDKLPPDRRVRLWSLNSDKFNRLYDERRVGGRVVDLGCGPRVTQDRVRAGVGTENYVGIDSDIKNRPSLVADIAHLPLAGESISLVQSFSVFEHTYNYKGIIDDIYRVLRPGGSLYIQTPFLLEFHGYPSDYFRFTHVAWQRILEDAGFQTVDYDIEWGRGFFINLAKMLESGSFSFVGLRWIWLRFTLRVLSKISWRLRWLDQYYRGNMYASVLIMGEKPHAGAP
jgi:SAM-dependent methyltransferase